MSQLHIDSEVIGAFPANFSDTRTLIELVNTTRLVGEQVRRSVARLESAGRIEKVGNAYRLRPNTPLLSSLLSDIFG